MSNTRVPRIKSDFNSYICDGDDYLQTVINPGPPAVTNWERLGLSEDEADNWHSKREEWNLLYPKYTNSAFHTKAITLEVKMFMESFTIAASLLLDKKITVSPNVNAQDAETFNFKLVRHAPTHPITPIPDTCFALIQPMGGGVVRVSCRTQEDGKRASMAKNANIIELIAKIGGTPPVSPDECTERHILGRANSIQSLGTDVMGKTIYAYFRWANTKYPHLSSQYSQMVTCIVS